jgi:hypothetical protein
MSDALSQMAKSLADGMTASASAPGSFNDTITINNGGYAYANTAITNNGVIAGSLGPYTVTTATTTQPWFSNSAAPKIRLDGEGADIEVNGVSLIDMIRRVEDRLNILTPNPELEADWDELRAIGEQYRRLEQHIKEKQATWDRLKAMTPPVVE